MGVDKTLLDVDGRALVSRVVDAVGEVCEHTLVVTNRPEALAEAGLPADVRILQDEVAYQGPLGGLVTALAAATDEWMLAVAADMPHLTPEVIRALWDLRDDADAVVPVTEKGLEPLLALYRVEACLPAAREVLATGRRRPVAVFPGEDGRGTAEDALRAVDPDLRSLINVNTPADLLDARETPSVEPRVVRGGVKLEVVEVSSRRSTRSMPSETPVTIYLNEREIATTQATPRDLEDLAAGFLLSEGLLTDRDALAAIDADAKRGLVWVTSDRGRCPPTSASARATSRAAAAAASPSRASATRAGSRRSTREMRVSADELYDLIGEMARRAEMYRDTRRRARVRARARGQARDRARGRGATQRARQGARPRVARPHPHRRRDPALDRAAVLRDDGEGREVARADRGLAQRRHRPGRRRRRSELNITLVGYARGGKLTVYTGAERITIRRGGLTPCPRR